MQSMRLVARQPCQFTWKQVPNLHRTHWGSRYKPSFVLGTTESQEDACGADAERRRALLAGDEVSNRALNCCVSILETVSFEVWVSPQYTCKARRAN